MFSFAGSIDESIDKVFGSATGWFVDFIFYQIPFSEDVKVYWVLFPLILGALFFTFYFRFINLTGFKTAVNIVRGKYDELDHHESIIAAGDSTPVEDNVETIEIGRAHV